jgi:hypothetical protein
MVKVINWKSAIDPFTAFKIQPPCYSKFVALDYYSVKSGIPSLIPDFY